MSKELEDLYRSANINVENMKQQAEIASEFKFQILKKLQNDQSENRLTFQWVMEPIDVSAMSKQDVEYQILSNNIFNSTDDAMNHITYLNNLERVIVAAEKVNIADNNYAPDFTNEDDRKYVVSYNERNQSLSYDYIYSVMAAYTDFRLCFRTQTITESFISNFSNELKAINKYRILYLKNK